jgi:hypothetical protein
MRNLRSQISDLRFQISDFDKVSFNFHFTSC